MVGIVDVRKYQLDLMGGNRSQNMDDILDAV